MQAKSAFNKLRFTGNCSRPEFERRCSAQDYWYHSFYFDNGFAQRGSYDISRDVGDYGFPSDMKGLSVLDVGTGSGWFATYFEQAGAEVTTVDARGYCDFDVYGRVGYPDVAAEKTSTDRVTASGQPIYFSPVSGGFWIMKDILGLKANYLNARVYDINPGLFHGKKFDLVFVGALLMHLRDPIGALMSLRTVCGGKIIANSLRLEDFLQGPVDESVPLMRLTAARSAPINWWAPNRTCLTSWFEAAGFRAIDCSREVNLTADKPLLTPGGQSDGAQNQILYVVHADGG